MQKFFILSLMVCLASANAFAAPMKAKRTGKKVQPKQVYMECMSTGGDVVLAHPHDCPIGHGSIDDFKRRMEERVRLWQ